MNPQTATPDTVALQQLHDLAMPVQVSPAPQTVGWYVLFAIVAALIIFAAFMMYRRYRANLYRRQALSELDKIKNLISNPAKRLHTLSEIPALLKRTALSFVPRYEIASLSCKEWLVFLDNCYEGNGFSEGPGRMLGDLSYSNKNFTDNELSDLIELTGLWIKKHKRK